MSSTSEGVFWTLLPCASKNENFWPVQRESVGSLCARLFQIDQSRSMLE